MLRRRNRSAAAKVGWITRRRRGKVVRRGPHKYVWKRPNSESVTFKGFNHGQMMSMKPVLKTTDNQLHPHIALNTTVKLAKRGNLEQRYQKHYGHNARVGALSYVGDKNSTIWMNPTLFDRHSYYKPAGTLSHELGHVVHYKNPNAKKSWDSSFRRSSGTRQGHDAAEDFAESFRSLQGFDITKRNRSYFKTSVDKSRRDHIRSNYLR